MCRNEAFATGTIESVREIAYTECESVGPIISHIFRKQT